MKLILKSLMAVAVIVLAAIASSCSKEGAAGFKGNYTFKTGGTLAVSAAGTSQTAESEMTTVSIVPESGQMDIIMTDKASGDMIVTMNILGGTVVTFHAKADGNILTLSPVARQIVLTPSNSSSELLRPTADVEVSGYGERFDGIVIFRLDYKGSYTYGGTEYMITESAVDCVAKRN